MQNQRPSRKVWLQDIFNGSRIYLQQLTNISSMAHEGIFISSRRYLQWLSKVSSMAHEYIFSGIRRKYGVIRQETAFSSKKQIKPLALAMGCAHCFFSVIGLLRSKLRQADDGEETVFVPKACNHK